MPRTRAAPPPVLPGEGLDKWFLRELGSQLVRTKQDSPAKAFAKTYRNDPVAFVHDCFFWRENEGPTAYQDEIMTELLQHKRVAIRGPHTLGKCMGENEDVLLADGRYELARNLIGRYFGVLSMNPNGSLGPALAYAFDNGLQPVYRITTHYGRELIRTANHPFLTFSGWSPVSNLKKGDMVAMATTLPLNGTRRLPDHEVKLLAYLIGDGAIGGKSSASFSQQPGLVLDEFSEIIASMGCSLRTSASNPYDHAILLSENQGKRFGKGIMQANPVVAILKRHDAWGKVSATKRIPTAIFEAPIDQIALFLNRLFATDGWAYGGGAIVAWI